MEITKDLVQYLESLGRLELSPEDEEKTQKSSNDGFRKSYGNQEDAALSVIGGEKEVIKKWLESKVA